MGRITYFQNRGLNAMAAAETVCSKQVSESVDEMDKKTRRTRKAQALRGRHDVPNKLF